MDPVNGNNPQDGETPSPAQNKRVLVWGPFGLIGSHLTAALLKAGFSVSVLCRGLNTHPLPAWAAHVRWFELGEEDNEAVFHRAVADASVIFDLAGSSGAVGSNSDPIESLHRNCGDQLQFLRVCQLAGHKPHVIFTSSRLVYGMPHSSPVTEDHPLAPQSFYAAHKLGVENYLQIYANMGALTYTICRIANAYGPDPRTSGAGYKILNAFIANSLSGIPITLFGAGDQERDFIYVEDLADLLTCCATNTGAINQIFNVGSGTACRLVDAAKIVSRLTSGIPLRYKPWPEEYLQVESGSYTSDISRARRLLGFYPSHSVERGIAKTIAAHRLQLAPRPGALPVVASQKAWQVIAT